MNQDQLDRIARMLHRISDREERAEIVREIAKVLADSETDFAKTRFYELASVEAPAD